MRKRLLSIVLTLCMVMTMLPVVTFATPLEPSVKIAGITLDRSHPYWVNGDTEARASVTTPGAYTAYFQVRSSTSSMLYLQDAEISSSTDGIKSDIGDLTIVCEGINKVTGAYSGMDINGNLAISGNGGLSVKAVTQHGILAQGTITISNDAGLSVGAERAGIWACGTNPDGKIDINTTGDITIKGNIGFGIGNNTGDITITSKNGTVKVNAQTDDGIYIQKGETLAVRGNKGIEINSAENYGVSGNGVNHTIIESEQGSVAINAQHVAVWGGTSDVKIYAAENVAITSTELTGIYVGKKVDISAGGNINIDAKDNGVRVDGTGDITLDAAQNVAVKGLIFSGDGSVYLSGTVIAGETLIIDNNTYIPKGKSLTNNGTITLGGGRIFTINGNLLGNGTITPKPVNANPTGGDSGSGGSNSGGSSGSGGSGGGGGSPVQTPTPTVAVDPISPEAVKKTEAAVQKLSSTQKQEIAQTIQEYLPYTLSAEQGITVEQLKVFTKDKFTKEELETLVKKPELLKGLGIDTSLLIVLTTLKPIEKAEFKDVPAQHWAADTIKEAAKLGIAAGMEDGNFAPSQPLQTEDTFTFLNRVLLMNHITESTLPRSTVEKYIIDKKHWAFSNMASIGAKLSENTLKIVSQREDKPLTRELLAQVIYEITKGKLKALKEVPAFTDIQNSPYQEAINYCVSTGLLNGTGKDNMSPEKELTRAELMTVLIRLNEKLK